MLGYAAVAAASLLFGMGYTLGSVVQAEGMSETCNSFWTASMALLPTALSFFSVSMLVI